MADSIFLIQGDDQLIEMGEKPYDSEALLQTLLAKFTDLLAGSQIDTASPRRWLLIKREMGIPAEQDGGERWSVDHLFLDQDAIPTLVEVKRSSDTRIRREVVGQMLDYAANAVVYWPVEQMRAEFEKNDDSPEDRLAEFLGEDGNPEAFWQKVKTNLQAGKVRMLFVADVIPNELRRIVEFLNEQMDPAEVLAVEIKQYIGENMKTLVPRVIGQTAEAATRKGGQRADNADLRRFWQGLLACVKSKKLLHANTAPNDSHCIGTGSGVRGLNLNYVIGQYNGRVELLFGADSETNKRLFDTLNQRKGEIEASFGKPLDWQRLEEKRRCRICFHVDTGGYRDDESKWPAIHDIMIDAMIRLEKALRPALDALEL